MKINKTWKPTPENINSLPKEVFEYIHSLESLCDPAGVMFENAMLKKHIDDLEKYIEIIKESEFVSN